MPQGPPNLGFMQEKVQKGGFLKKDSRELNFFSCYRFLWISRRPGTLNLKRVVFLPSKNLYRKCGMKYSTLKTVIFASYWGSPLVLFSKFTNFLWVCWFLCKNLFNFVSLPWKFHSQYCHNAHECNDYQIMHLLKHATSLVHNLNVPNGLCTILWQMLFAKSL